MKVSRGPRGPYKTKSKKQWTPRRKLASSKQESSQSLPVPTKYPHIATAITLAVNKLLEIPKYHTKKVPGRRLNFKVVTFHEIFGYMKKHPSTCNLEACDRLPSRPTIFRLMSAMGLSREARTRSTHSYRRNFSDLS